MPRNKYSYDQKYQREHIKMKGITFNDTKLEDVEMMEWIDQQGNITKYIKGLVKDDMDRRKQKDK